MMMEKNLMRMENEKNKNRFGFIFTGSILFDFFSSKEKNESNYEQLKLKKMDDIQWFDE